jgi:DNA polymerase-3 subunit beta
MELGIEKRVNCKIKETGSIVLESKVFGEIVRKLPEGEVYMDINNNNNAYIKCGEAEFNISGFSSEEYPKLSEIDKKEKPITIEKEKLRSLIKQTFFAVSIDESKPSFTGALMKFEKNEIKMISLDGYRLALRKEIIENESEDFSIIIPGKTLNELSKILGSGDENVTINNTGKQILFEFDSCKVISRLIEGEFFDYKNIIPKEHSLRVKVAVKNLTESIERASLLNISENKKYPVKLNIEMDKIVISCLSDIGSVQDVIKVETQGEDIEIGFNHRYLLDALKTCECSEIYMDFNKSLNPCIIRPVEGDKFIHLILPVRI